MIVKLVSKIDFTYFIVKNKAGNIIAFGITITAPVQCISSEVGYTIQACATEIGYAK